jgi:hypothetical protein
MQNRGRHIKIGKPERLILILKKLSQYYLEFRGAVSKA